MQKDSISYNTNGQEAFQSHNIKHMSLCPTEELNSLELTEGEHLLDQNSLAMHDEVGSGLFYPDH